MRRLFFWTTILSGAAAAYMMHKRGESLSAIARRSFSNPVGSLINEVRGTR